MSTTREDTEALAEQMHDAYEAAAAEQGWATQERRPLTPRRD